jgi:uncharacterized protein (TIGR02452 family)
MELKALGAIPNQNRRTERARRAKQMVGKSIPDVLRNYPRARHGCQKAELVVDPPAVSTFEGDLGVTAFPSHPNIRLWHSDTLTAAGRLSEQPFAAKRTVPTLKAANSPQNVVVLNMASPVRPGGGFLDGANSQEEFLCHRSTLFPSLWDSFYRLPDVGGIYTPDVLVYRDTTPDAIDLPKRERYFVDVITAGAFKFPDLRRGRSDDRLDGACSCGMSYCDRDRDLVTRKMRAVLRMAQSKGAKKVVLGAWGCGAFGNPVKDVARLWRKVIAGSPRQRKPNAEQWEGIEEIVFAVPDQAMMREFKNVFRDIEAPVLPPTPPADEDAWPGAEKKKPDPYDLEVSRLIQEVEETELQMEGSSNGTTRALLGETLAKLNNQLVQARAARASKEEDQSEEEAHHQDELIDDFVLPHIPASDSDDENVYAFDDETFDFELPPSPSYEFRPPPPGLDPVTSHDEDDDPLEPEPFQPMHPSPRFDAKTGWYSGSIDEFQGFLRNNGQTSAQLSRTSPDPEECMPKGSPGQMPLSEGLLDSYFSRYQGTDAPPSP